MSKACQIVSNRLDGARLQLERQQKNVDDTMHPDDRLTQAARAAKIYATVQCLESLLEQMIAAGV